MVELLLHVRHNFEPVSDCCCPHVQYARVQFVRGEIYQFRDQIKQITLVWYSEKFR
jgi:hypothetical protein